MAAPPEVVEAPWILDAIMAETRTWVPGDRIVVKWRHPAVPATEDFEEEPPGPPYTYHGTVDEINVNGVAGNVLVVFDAIDLERDDRPPPGRVALWALPARDADGDGLLYDYLHVAKQLKRRPPQRGMRPAGMRPARAQEEPQGLVNVPQNLRDPEQEVPRHVDALAPPNNNSIVQALTTAVQALAGVRTHIPHVSDEERDIAPVRAHELVKRAQAHVITNRPFICW